VTQQEGRGVKIRNHDRRLDREKRILWGVKSNQGLVGPFVCYVFSVSLSLDRIPILAFGGELVKFMKCIGVYDLQDG